MSPEEKLEGKGLREDKKLFCCVKHTHHLTTATVPRCPEEAQQEKDSYLGEKMV